MPKNKKGIQKLLGALNLFRSQLNNYSQKLYPITIMLRNEVPFSWKETHTKIVMEIIDELNQVGTTYHPDFNKPFELYTDASDYAIGAALIQNHVPIMVYSKTLHSAQITQLRKRNALQ